MNASKLRTVAGLVGLGLTVTGFVTASANEAPAAASRSDAAGDNYYSTVREAATGLDEFTVYRPDNLTQFAPRSVPVVVWGNGGCDRSNLVVAHYLQQIAAEGYIVVADGGLETAPDSMPDSTPNTLVEAIDWALGSKAAKNQLQNRVDPDKVASMGRSCGGLQSLRAGQDPRVKSVTSLHSGYFPTPRLGYDIAELANIDVPILFANGGPEDVAYATSRTNYELADVPAALVEYSTGGHHGITSGLDLSTGEIESDFLYRGVQTAVNWLDYTLNDDQDAKTFFVGTNCGLCNLDQWSVKAKGL